MWSVWWMQTKLSPGIQPPHEEFPIFHHSSGCSTQIILRTRCSLGVSFITSKYTDIWHYGNALTDIRNIVRVLVLEDLRYCLLCQALSLPKALRSWTIIKTQKMSNFMDGLAHRKWIESWGPHIPLANPRQPLLFFPHVSTSPLLVMHLGGDVNISISCTKTWVLHSKIHTQRESIQVKLWPL